MIKQTLNIKSKQSSNLLIRYDNNDFLPIVIYKSLAYMKKSAAKINYTKKIITEQELNAIINASNDVIETQYYDKRHLFINTHNSINTYISKEVINSCRKYITIKTEDECSEKIAKLEENQHDNDTFVSSMNLSIILEFNNKLLPEVFSLSKKLLKRKLHAYNSLVSHHVDNLQYYVSLLSQLPQGGMNIGTGFNSDTHFDKMVIRELSNELDLFFDVSKNKFEAMSCHDTILSFHQGLCQLANSFITIYSKHYNNKLSNETIGLLKMNYFQMEGNNIAITIGNMNGNFQANSFKTLILNNTLNSLYLLIDSCSTVSNNI